MLGIVPGNINSQNSDENSGSDDESSLKDAQGRRKSKIVEPVKTSFLRRLSTLRKSDKSQKSSKNSKNTGAIRDGKLPAKYIQTTDVKKATLNPVWFEKFRFKIDNIDTDVLHLDIWDHDDEFSVFDAAKKLNEIKGFKGLDRYFKQIAQSARTNKAKEDSNVDDFLGAININVNNIPSNGFDGFYDLEGRTEKSNVEGKIRLRLNLATREDRGQLDDQVFIELKQHGQLLEIFIDYEISKFKGNNDEWKGFLSREAETVLHQHAIQGDLTEIQLAICNWNVYSKKQIEHRLSYRLILSMLEKLENLWKHDAVTRDEIDSLNESFTSVLTYNFKLLGKIRDLFPPDSKLSGIKLENVLKLIRKIHISHSFKHCCPFQNSMLHEITQNLKTGTSQWFERIKKQNLSKKSSEEDNFKKLIDILNILIIESNVSLKYYHPIFEKELSFQYFPIILKQFDFELHKLMQKILVEEFGDDYFGNEIENEDQPIQKAQTNNNEIESLNSLRKMSLVSVVDYGSISDENSLLYFELYLSFCELYRLKVHIEEKDVDSLKMLKLNFFFRIPFKRWFDLIKIKLDFQVEKLAEAEKYISLKEPIDSTTSCLELASCITKMSSFWKLLEWPEQKYYTDFSTKLFIDATKSCTRYATILVEIYQTNQIIQATLLAQNDKNSKDQEQIHRCLIFINNIEKLRESLQNLQNDLEKPKKVKDIQENKNNLGVNDSLSVLIDHFIESIIKNHFQKNIDANLFFFYESPENTSAQESLSRLLNFLNTNLGVFKQNLVRINFQKLLKSLWCRIVESIRANMKTDTRMKTVVMLNKTNEAVHILLEFLNADNQGLSREILISNDAYKEFRRVIKIQLTDTNHLLLLYYQEMINIQNSIKNEDYGVMYCRAYYHTKDETLCVEIIKCKNLIPMDQNGLSDPYVEVELKPRYIFPECHKQTTSIIKKTLNPKFEEKFEFKISEQSCLTPGAVIHLTAMDHDLIGSNDFEGEVFIELSSVPGVHRDLGDGGYRDLKVYEMPLLNPKNHKNLIWDELQLRTYDKLAVDFVKTRKDKFL